ncbi:class I SAM-dependent methyltransferase [Synechococcus sp. R55.6]|uniref:class I SAM-dependent methyltransferase n=1 Tax=unclassified Synechococcus TaxID=2626047 RepID=UPI0039C0F5BA
MNLYRRVIFPQLLDLALSGERIERYRRQLLAHVQGSVLEIGFGTGLNLSCYPEHIRKITGVDPNPGMGSLARRRIASSPIAVDWQVADAQELPFPSQSFDSVVSTWTLCSIPNVAKALGEIRRVLRAGGKLFFLEHGLSEDPQVQRWQNRLNPLQKVIADGCNLNRDMARLIREAGFRFEQLERFYMPDQPRFIGYTYQGIALPAAEGNFQF